MRWQKHVNQAAQEGSLAIIYNHWTLLTPFIALSLLALPSLLVLLMVRQSASYEAFNHMTEFVLIKGGLWLCVPLSVLCGVVFIIKSKGMAGRIGAAALITLMTTCFIYTV